MKQFVLFFILMQSPLLAIADDSGSCGSNVTYTYVEQTQTLTISGTGNMDSYNYSYHAPWYPYKDNIIKILIDDGVTSIGSYAFSGCSGLLSITLPESLTHIYYYAFQYCSSLLSVMIPNGLTSIGSYAFRECSSMLSVTIPESVTKIDSYAFWYCNGLTSVHISNLESWCNIVFENGKSNPLSYAQHLFLNGEEIKDLVIPSNVTSIRNYAFTDCSGLTSVTIPESVTSIGVESFYNCSGLKSITISEGVTSIGSSAFSGCSGITTFMIPDGVTNVEEYTFSRCNNLVNVSLPEGLKSIKKGAFKDCIKIESIMIPSSVEYIYAEVFKGCSKLKEVKALPENPPFLYENALSNYANITLKMPNESQEAYMTTSPWDKFGSYQTLTGDDITKKKCSKPTITFENGVLHFTCETADVTYKYNISGASSGEGNDVGLSSITVSVYATRSGYDDSETTTMEIATSGIQGDVDGNGVVNVADHVKLSSIILDQNK